MVEAAGIPTVSISIVRKLTVEAKVPRAVFVKWPMGHPLGEPGRVEQQRVVLECAFRALVEIKEPGTIVDLPFRWRRYEDLTREVEIE